MSDKNKQHYVPRMYLRNFANGNLFDLYNIKNGLIKNVAFNSQCYKNNFYGSDKVYETKLSELENKWSYSIKQVINNVDKYDNIHEGNIKEFCCFQYFRTEAAHLRTKAAYLDITKKILPSLCQMENIAITNEQIEKFAYNYVESHENTQSTMKMLIDNATKLSPDLGNLQFTVLENNTEINFITSDNPVIIGNEFQKEHGLGIDCIGFYMLMPLSPRYYVAIVDAKIYSKFRNKRKIEISLDMVKQLNHAQFINSLVNIYANSTDEIKELEEYIDGFIPTIKCNLLDNYNKNYNNFLSADLKKQANLIFKNMLEIVNTKIYKNICKNQSICFSMDLLELCNLAKPFANRVNYNFHRSASYSDMKLRISFMKICNDKIIKELSKQDDGYVNEIELVKKYEEFLEKYFTDNL